MKPKLPQIVVLAAESLDVDHQKMTLVSFDDLVTRTFEAENIFAILVSYCNLNHIAQSLFSNCDRNKLTKHNLSLTKLKNK